MGGVDGGVRFNTTTSPRQAAIEKAQAELRQEYDVRKERKRELEFLEKGGNPLDFKFSLSASISVQSTSVKDQPLEHETKGSVALASPHSDSAESSGHPGAPSLRESNFADNLLLFDGETSKVDGQRNGLNTGKRKSVASFEQPSTFDGNNSVSEDSAIFHLAVKRQAYARRYRLKTSHDGVQFGPHDLTEAGQGNQETLLSTQADGDAVKKAHVDVHIPVCNAKPISSSRNNDYKNVACEVQLGTELDMAQNNKTCADLQELSAGHVTISSEKLDQNNFNDHLPLEGSEQKPNAIISSSSKLLDTRRETLTNCFTQAPLESDKQLESIDKSCSSGFTKFDAEAKILQNQDQVEKFVSQDGSDISTHHGLEAEPACDKINHAIDGNATVDCLYSGEIIGPCNRGRKEKKTVNETIVIPDVVKDNGDLQMDDADLNAKKEQNNAFPAASDSNTEVKDEKFYDNKLDVHDGMRSVSIVENIKVDGEFLSKPEGKFCTTPPHVSDAYQEALLGSTRNGDLVSPICKHLEVSLSQKGSASLSEHQSESGENINVGKSHEEEEHILQEAHLIETKLKRAQETPHCIFHSVNQRKSHWGFVLEEMAWLANDFMQERLWKITTASQICRMVATRGRLKIENSLWLKQKAIAQMLAKSVVKFWTSVEENKNVDENMQFPQLPIKHYAARFLQSESRAIEVVPAEAPKTPDRTSDAGSLESPWQEQILDELFYKVPFGSMHAYRESVETDWLRHESQKALKITNHLHRKASVGDFAAGAFDFPYVLGTQPTTVDGKRTSETLNLGSIPTKRHRRAHRKRAVSPFSVSSTGVVPITSKTDASSGDTSSFQDDQSTLQGGFYPRKGSEFESTVDFGKKPSFDGNEVHVKLEMKKKPKYMGYKGSSQQKWPVDSFVQLEQKDHIKKRLEGHQSESNGTIGIYMHQATKKPKISKPLAEMFPEALVPLSGPVHSPVPSQMSNMSNPNKSIKVFPNRDRGRKNKALKVIGGQSASGSSWSQFEDQTLVVLVHDMGPNWELISDAINSTLRFKAVFHDPKACKDRHKILMDKNASDGGDSAEDSGSSQPYPSTLPGIPKGSARQLFECLQGPIEEDTLKAQFEKIIHIGQKMHSLRIQKDNLDSKQVCPAHNSHIAALSQACPNNLAGGLLTPLDLCDATTSNSTEVLGFGYQGASSSGLTPPCYQGPTSTILPAPGANNMLQGSPSMVMGNCFPSSAASNAPIRDGPRYGVPKPASLPVDDQQRLQQYGQHISGRNAPGALPVGADHGVHMLSGANGVGMVGGMSRGMPLTRPGFQGIGSPGVLNMVSSGSMPSSTGAGVPSPVSIHPGPGHAQGNSMMRPRDSLQMLRSGQNPEDHRQMMQEFRQVTQGNGQTMGPFNGTSAPFPNQPMTAPPVQSFPVQQHNQPHQMAQQSHMLGNTHHPHIQGTNHNSPQQQAYAMRVAKERQLQQQRLGQSAFPGSNGTTPQQSNPHVQQTAQSSPTTVSSHVQQKQQNIPHNPQNAAILPNQVMKQRQRQQIQQQFPRQQATLPSQAKLMRVSGRRNILVHQNSPVDASHVNSPSASGNQVLEKRMLQQNQAMLPGNQSLNSTLHQKTGQQKIYGRPQSQFSKQTSAVPPHPDGVSQGQVQASASQQAHVSNLASQNLAQRQTNQHHQTMHRVVLHPNHKLNSDNHMHSATDPVQSSQMMASPSKSSDSVNAIPDASSASVSASQWKPEQPFETASRTPNALLSNSSQPIVVGKESLMSASNQGLVQRQFPGNHPVQGRGSGGPWHHQLQPQQPQQQQQSYPPHHQMHQQAGQGVVYGRPANTGPG